MRKCSKIIFILFLFFSEYSAFSQVPTCPSPYVWMDGGPFIKFYDPSLPLSATNPSTTNIPTFGSGLALMPNINGGTPSPTFYSTSGGFYYWFNGTSWVNTGHSTGNGAAVNLGGCGSRIYNLVGGTGQVYVYNGTGPGTLLTTIVGFNGGGPYDIVCDCNCNFYMLNTTTPNQALTMYSPTGAVICTYSLTGMPNTTAGGGFAIIGNMIYVKNNLANGFFIGTMAGATITFTQMIGFTASPGDFACCPVCNTLPATATTSGTLGCNVNTVNVVATTTVAGVTYTWTGPGLVGATNASVAVANAPGVYTCVISAGVCPPTQTIVTTTVTSNGANLTVTFTPTGTITCANPTVGITANPGPAGYTYTWTGVGIIGATNGQSITVGTPGTFTAAVAQTSTGCVGSQTITITSNTTIPIVTVTPSNTTICAGTNVVLTAGGALTYTWNTGATTTSISLTPLATTSYTVIGKAANGCTNSAVSTVSVIALPVPLITSNSPICVGSILSLSVTGGTTFNWAGPNLFNSIIQNPSIPNVTALASGVYTVIATVGICTGSATSNIVINPLPIPIAAVNNPVCVGQPINLTGAGALTYTWTGPGGYASQTANPTIPIAAITNAGTYTLTVTDANGCKNSTTANLTVNTLPVIVVNNPVTCLNQPINLTATGGATYYWSGPLSFTSNVQNPIIPSAALGMTGAYNVLVTSAQGCTNTAISNVTVTPLPVATITSNTPCLNGTLNLSGGGGINYSWFGPGGFASGVQNPSIPNVTLGTAGMYTLTVTSGTCTSSSTAIISINPLPVPVALSNAPVCEGQAINFTGSGGIIYNWSGPSFNSNAQNPGILVAGLPNNGPFVLTVTDINGCTNSTTINVVVNTLPVVGISGATVCANTAINLNANGGINYSWSGPAGFTSNVQSPVIPNANPGMAGVYNVTVTNGNGCVNNNFTNVIVNPMPTPTAFNSGPLCINQLLNLSANGGLTYSWSGPGGFFSTSQSPTLTATSTNMSGNYTVTVTDNIGCTGTAVTLINIYSPPNVAIVAGVNKGCAPLCVTFTCVTSPGASVNWSFGDGASAGGVSTNNCFKTASNYTVNVGVTDVNGCTNSNTFPVNVYPNPIADFNFAPLRPIENVDEVIFTDASYAATIASWNWYLTNNSNNQSNLQNPHFVYPEMGTYPVVLVVKSDKGCMDTIIKVITIGEDYGIYVPNAFTPNGDGLNDIFQPKGFGVSKYEFSIFDRWGEKIFLTNSFDKGWDGTINGLNAKDDVYAWRIKLTNVFGKSHELTGHVTLIK